MEPDSSNIEQGTGDSATPAQETGSSYTSEQGYTTKPIPLPEDGFSFHPIEGQLIPPSNDLYSPNTAQETVASPNTEQNEGRTVLEYYRGIADANSTTAKDLQGLLNEKAALGEQLKDTSAKVEDLSHQMANTPFYNVPEKIGTGRELRAAEAVFANLTQKLQQDIPDQIAKTRAPATEYTGTIASDETVVRATNPARLQTLIDANTPLPKQEASVRIADLTPEQIQERKRALLSRSGALDPDRLPDDRRTQEEKEIDSAEAQLESEMRAVKALTKNLLIGMEKENHSIDKGMEKWEISNPEAVRDFAEYALYIGTKESGVPTDLLEEGSISIRTRIQELNRMQPSMEVLGEIENLQYFAERVEKIENHARFSMAMWQMSNEITSAVSGTEVDSNTFSLYLASALLHISNEGRDSQRDGRDFRAVMEYMSRLNPGSGLAEELGLYYTNFPELYDISMRMTEFAGHDSPADLNRGDVPKILAYLCALVENDEKAFEKKGFFGVDAALAVAIREPNINSPDHKRKTMDTLIKDIRPNINLGVGYTPNHGQLAMISKEYLQLLMLSGIRRYKQPGLLTAFGAGW